MGIFTFFILHHLRSGKRQVPESANWSLIGLLEIDFLLLVQDENSALHCKATMDSF